MCPIELIENAPPSESEILLREISVSEEEQVENVMIDIP
jgi:hypothetical protein